MERFKTIDELRNETNGQTRFLFHSNYWDGPLSGVMLWEGKKAYFKAFNDEVIKTLLSSEDQKELEEEYKLEGLPFEEDDKWEYETIRSYGAYALDDETMEAILFNNELFCKYVGTHNLYDENGNRGRGARIPLRPDHPEDIGDLRPYSEHDKFYKGNEQKNYKLELNETNLIGKFER